MTTTTNDINWFITAGTLRSAFKQETRDDGSKFYSCQHVDAGTELLAFIQDLHDDELPNDWRYDTIVSILDALCDVNDRSSYQDIYDLAGGIADNITDIYNSDLFRWYADHPNRVAYFEQATDDGLITGDTDTIARLSIGQNECIRSMCDKIIARLIDQK